MLTWVTSEWKRISHQFLTRSAPLARARGRSAARRRWPIATPAPDRAVAVSLQEGPRPSYDEGSDEDGKGNPHAGDRDPDARAAGEARPPPGGAARPRQRGLRVQRRH